MGNLFSKSVFAFMARLAIICNIAFVLTIMKMLMKLPMPNFLANFIAVLGLEMSPIVNICFAIWWIAAVPMSATYLLQNNPQLINKVSPIIAKIFTPLVFINLLVYLTAVIYTGKYPYNDRNLLLVFNVLLIGVMALILFSVAEAGKSNKGLFNLFLLFALSSLTIIINSIALTAISYRILEFGITPNRIAVLGGNILIFIHLLMVSYKLFKTVRGKAEIEAVETSIALFLPVYSIWTAIIIFVLPFIFNFK